MQMNHVELCGEFTDAVSIGWHIKVAGVLPDDLADVPHQLSAVVSGKLTVNFHLPFLLALRFFVVNVLSSFAQNSKCEM